MNIKDQLKEYQIEIDGYIKDFLAHKKDEYSQITKFSGEIVDELSQYMLRGGKRIRAALIFYTYKIFSKKDISDDDLKFLSMFVEFVHSYFLIHDDIMDRDSMRHGGKTMHYVYEGIGSDLKIKDFKHFGLSMGILAGDLSHSLAFNVLGNSAISDSMKSEVIKIASERINSTIFGQSHDILLAEAHEYNEEDVLLIHTLKTARYTFDTPVLIGATLAEASEEEKKILNEYSIPAGIAFQIRDDILGVFGEEDKTGKSAHSDLKEGKRTLLIHEALRKATPEQKDVIDRLLGKQDMTNAEAEEIRKVIRDTGSLEYSKELTKVYVEKAINALNKLPQKDSEGWKFLEAVANYMVVREV